MWQLDTTQQTYTPTNATHWTWAKVSASALKYLKSRHSNVPSFIPLISSGKNKDKYDPTVYELGRELHKLTRYAFDKLKENPNSNIKDLFHTISKGNNKSRNIVKFGNEGNDKHDEKEILNVIDEFRNEHYNNMINTLRVDLKSMQDTIGDIQKDIQNIKEFIVTYKSSNKCDNCDIYDEILNENTTNEDNCKSGNCMKFGMTTQELIEKLKNTFLKKKNTPKAEEKKEEDNKTDKKDENMSNENKNVATAEAEAQLDLNDNKSEDKMCMINVNMPVIHTAPIAEFHQPVQLQPPQIPNTEGGGGAGPGGNPNNQPAFPTGGGGGSAAFNPPVFPTGGGGVGREEMQHFLQPIHLHFLQEMVVWEEEVVHLQ